VPEDKFSADYPTDLSSWRALKKHYSNNGDSLSLQSLFAIDPQRFADFSLEAADLFLDFSKNLVDRRTLELLVALARETRVPESIGAMFAGDAINATEGRPALHVALRAGESEPIASDVPGVRDIWPTLDRMSEFVAGVRQGRIHGHTGKPLTEIVNIGIGGSDLGTVMATRALRNYWQPGMRVHCVSNVDGTQLVDLTAQLDPAQTLFVICSKTFTTRETMSNATVAGQWITETLGAGAIGAHFAAASTNHAAMDAFGIDPGHRFGFWDWVGGRYSIWSAVGLPLALVIGMERFLALHAGARAMDRHFRSAGLERNFLGAASKAVLPYDSRLDRFPAFLQQLHMESNGKRVRIDGTAVVVNTAPVIWGEPGSNAQHSFYQLLHQGTDFVPVDFILPVKSSGGVQDQQNLAAADCIAQSEALMDGYSTSRAVADLVDAGLAEDAAATLAPHKVHPGNRPSNTILLPQLTPETLGQLIALYEHKIFVEGVIWGINSFDQFGVELGKRIAAPLGSAIHGDSEYAGKNDSSAGLLAKLKELQA